MLPSENTLEFDSPAFSLDGFLAEEHARDLLRFSTAGSVDDGKSTLIGRLLYDTQNVYDDQVLSIQGKGTTAPGILDLALLTDGLRAEREQGITIDVAYRYFSTTSRKFIIADTPGHEQYTRNMATGASTADLALVLVDARKGVLIQSRRHAYITALLGVRHILIAVNKMDLVGYDEVVFDTIRAEFTSFFDQLGEFRPPHLYFVPVSALSGDNVVRPTSSMPWYTGPSLLQLLESVPAIQPTASSPFRLAVQRVLRPDQNFRGFAGQIASGTIRPGDPIMVLPSRRTSRVRSIVTFDGDLAEAHAPQSISLTFDDELDVSRGDLLVSPDSPAEITNRFTASLVWMGEHPLDLSRRYALKHTSRTVQASVIKLLHRVEVATLERQPASSLVLNDIGLVELESVLPLAVDRYSANHTIGSFVLIDPISNATVAAGMIRNTKSATALENSSSPVTPEERSERWRHVGAHIHLTAPDSFVFAIERVLFLHGAFVVRISEASSAIVEALTHAGALTITHTSSDIQTVTLREKQASVANIDDLLRFLSSHSVLKGDITR
jgi:sulfate adenylyltransferase large subunit